MSELNTEELEKLQQWMFDSLVAPHEVDSKKIEDTLLPSPTLNAKARLGIYQRSYVLRLCKCLEEQFPALTFALGQSLFNEFAREYLATYPSQSYTLYDLGSRFTQFLEETRPDKDHSVENREQWIDFMIDLSHYEFQLFSLFDALGNEKLVIPNASIDDAHITLQPCFSVHQYRYPVAAYYHQVAAGNKPKHPVKAMSYVAISRKNYITASYPINKIHYLFLNYLKQSQSVETAIHQVAKTINRSYQEVKDSWHQEVRTMWFNTGFFIDNRL